MSQPRINSRLAMAILHLSKISLYWDGKPSSFEDCHPVGAHGMRPTALMSSRTRFAAHGTTALANYSETVIGSQNPMKPEKRKQSGRKRDQRRGAGK